MNPPISTHFQDFYDGRGWTSFPFQQEMLERYQNGFSGILNAPTGSGKTLAMWVPILIDWIQQNPDYKTKEKNGLQVLWISPLRALAKDAAKAMQEACVELEIPWEVQMRTGDTPASVKARQDRRMPECLITTPESLHILFARKNHTRYFKNLTVLVVDEWHELMGSKRGVQLELGAAHLKTICPNFKIWGISATIGNMEDALKVLLGNWYGTDKQCFVKAKVEKKIVIESVLPVEIETFPWSGHLGVHMIHQVVPIIEGSTTTLLFTNTRNQAEIWYHALLNERPDWAGLMALHHGSLSQEVRTWVEDALHEARLKVVVCTSSLDLGVDFRPVETVIQVGGPKGVAKFIQRAGRSGHQPGATSTIHFVPTNSLELVEAAALRRAVASRLVEDRIPIVQAFDTVIQFMMTLAVGDGFDPKELFEEVKKTFSYQYLNQTEWQWMLDFIITGGESLEAYDEYNKAEIDDEGRVVVTDKRIAGRHRLSMGTIVSSMQLIVKYLSGKNLGTVEETFVSTLEPGDHFWFSGRPLEFIKIRGNIVYVRKSKNKKGKIPSWQGSRMPLSSQMADLLREELDMYAKGKSTSEEILHLRPLLNLQSHWSIIPDRESFLIESLHSHEGHHIFIYPFEGRVIHEMLGALFAYRLSQLQPLSFSIAMNDYGLELLSDEEIPIHRAIEEGLFSTENLTADMERSINETLMAVKKFHEIAHISGLMFRGYPGKYTKNKHLQANSGLLFKVFKEYDPGNLLLQQAYTEVIDYQIDSGRLRQSLERITHQEMRIIDLKRPTPFAFPIMVDRMREKLSSEKLKDRIAKMHMVLKG